MADLPWYADGLAFACRSGCGRCCHGPGGYVLVSAAEAESLAAALSLSATQFGQRFLRRVAGGLALRDAPNGDCILLQADGRCRAYEARPRQCRTFPWWPEIVANPAAWENAKRRCPGIGVGREYSAAEIQAALSCESDGGLAWLAEASVGKAGDGQAGL